MPVTSTSRILATLANLSISRHSGDGRHSKPGDSADFVFEDDSPHHIEVANREFIAEFAWNSMAKM